MNDDISIELPRYTFLNVFTPDGQAIRLFIQDRNQEDGGYIPEQIGIYALHSGGPLEVVNQWKGAVIVRSPAKRNNGKQKGV